MREDGGEEGNERRAPCVVLRGKTGGGSDGMHNLISHTGNCCTPEKPIFLGNDQIYRKAAITAPFTIPYLMLGNPWGAVALLKSLSSLFPPSWTQSSDYTQALHVLLILCEFSREKQPETEQLL